MEYLDLNIKPTLLDNEAITKSISNLITNAILQCNSQEYIQNSIIHYDNNSRTLQIKDEGVGIQLVDFVAHLNSSANGITSGLRDAICVFLANKITIKITSNFGTFTPVLRNKEVNGKQIPCVFIAYESSTLTNNSLKKHGTQITLSPIKKQIMADLKPDFSFLQNWTKAITTNRGSILIGKTNTNLYVNGKNITHFENNDVSKHHFIFSYDFNENPSEPMLFNKTYEALKNVFLYINQILQQLNNEDKETIYAKLINNNSSYEWNDEKIRNTIIKYLTKLNPTRYVIALLVEKSATFENYMEQKKVKVIWIKDEDEYDKLISEGVKNATDLVKIDGEEEINENTFKFIDPNDLNDKEKENWQTLLHFLKTFLNESDYIQTKKKAIDLNVNAGMNIKINDSKEYPTNLNDFDHDYIIIDRRYLSDTKGELFDQVSDLVFDAIMDDDFSGFKKAWNNTLVNEVFKHYQANQEK